ncbi:MAG: flagellar hook-associated protein FlgL [Deltaproteobacteria bacterium]|nr:flagellar hook-associated protein FlgL [Deltaproteobacteria bacterium]
MRVSNKAIYDTVNHNLAKSSDAMLQANQVVSTGKKINRLSDDPVGLVSVLSLRSSLEYIGQLERNITMGRSWLNMGETALSQVEDLLSQTKALTIQMSSDSQGAEERANSAEAVEGFFQQILSLANTEVDGRYIFAGTNTDTVPYVLGTDDGGNAAVTYQGNDKAFEVRIAESINVAVGRIGTDIFGTWGNDLTADGDPLTDNWGDPAEGTNNIFKTLLDLKESLQSNDEAGIRGTMDELDTQLNRIRALIADTGSKLNRVELKETIIQDLRLTYTDRKSELEDADVAEAIMDLQAKQLAYQAALKSSSQVMKLSLVDFL